MRHQYSFLFLHCRNLGLIGPVQLCICLHRKEKSYKCSWASKCITIICLCDIRCIEPNHLSTLHHTPERQKRIHTHINFKFIVSYISHNENPRFIATEESPSNDHRKCFIDTVTAIVWIATYNHIANFQVLQKVQTSIFYKSNAYHKFLTEFILS